MMPEQLGMIASVPGAGIDESMDERPQSTGSSVSVIVPTIGRVESLRRLLRSLAVQTVQPGEVIVADGSSDDATERLLIERHWMERGLSITRIAVHPPHAVRQREAAIALATGEWLLFLDDDVVLESDCLEQLLRVGTSSDGVSGVMATFTNQVWPKPRPVWRWYLALVHGIRGDRWHGRVVGPLLRYGFNPVPADIKPVEWISTCNSLVSRDSYDAAGGFSDFFLYRCTMNEDVDLGLKLSRVGRLLFCPQARLAHYHAPAGRLTAEQVAEDDLFNRYLVLLHTLQRSKLSAFASVAAFCLVETGSNVVGGLARCRLGRVWPLIVGRTRGLQRVLRYKPETSLASPHERTAVSQ